MRAPLLVALLLAACCSSAAAAPGDPVTTTFAYTGATQTFTVPTGVTTIDVTAYGGSGGAGTGPVVGGEGATTTATVPVTPGEQLAVEVGGRGVDGVFPGSPGGYNGGGESTLGDNGRIGGSGGGATDLRRGTTLANRLVVAAGGGGGGGSVLGTFPCTGSTTGAGGDGGGATGAPGADSSLAAGTGGAGGTQLGGGAAGTGGSVAGAAGSLGQGGDGGGGGAGPSGGAGGGGWYGGGGGATFFFCSAPPGAGGGGSSYIAPGATGTMTRGGNVGDGELTIGYVEPDTTAPTILVTAPADGASYPVGSAVTAAYGCNDDVGATTCSGTVANGATLPTALPGTFTFTVTSSDAAGNTNTRNVSYSVSTPISLADFGRGPFPPAELPPLLSSFDLPTVSPPAAVSPAAAPTRLTISRARVSPRCVRQPRARDLRFRFTLSEPATVTYEVVRRLDSPAWRVCPPARPGQGKPISWGSVGGGAYPLGAGAHGLGVRRTAAPRAQTLGLGALRWGTYLLRLTARTADGRTAHATIRFWVLRSRR